MRVIPVLVAYFTADWIRVAITSYLHHFPDDRVLVVDNNPKPGEVDWRPMCERERHWLRSHPSVDLLLNPLLPSPLHHNGASHGLGMDAALDWCRDRGAEVLLHFEPDCLVEGRRWRDNLLDEVSRGAWMAGSLRKEYGPIHPTPSAWRVDKVGGHFAPRERAPDELHPRFGELFDLGVLESLCRTPDARWFFRRFWDTAEKPWFLAELEGKAALAETPDFRHYWLGSTTQRLDESALTGQFPELAPWFERAARRPPRRVDDCPFRVDVRGEGRGQTARCALLPHWLGSELAGLPGEVGRDACAACCASWPPSHTQLNPVVGSFLVRLCDQAAKSGAADGPLAAHVEALRVRAECELEVSCDEPALSLPGRGAATCAHFGAAVGFRPSSTAAGPGRATVYECRHPGHRETTPAECHLCRDWSTTARVDLAPLREILPGPGQRRGPRVRTWAVGVITAPRRTPTLDMCVDSLIRAGWERPRLFVDSSTTIAMRHEGLPLTLREPKVGAWPNYYLALAELVMREPEADAYMLAEDDVLFFDREDLRAYLEEVLWPAAPVGAVSLYCASMYTQPEPGWHRFDGEWVWGALAFIFPRESARRFLGDPMVLGHRASNDKGLEDTDVLIGAWSHQRELPVYFPTPSLVQHIGETSTLWPTSRAFGLRRADRFAGDLGFKTESERF